MKLVENLLDQKLAAQAENQVLKERIERREDRLSLEALHLEEMTRKLKREKADAESERLQDQIRAADRFERAHQEYTSQLLPLSQEISDLKKIIEGKDEAHAKRDEENDELRAEIEALKEKVTAANEQIRELSLKPSKDAERIRELEEEVEERESRILGLETTLDFVKQDLEKAKTEYQQLKMMKAESNSMREMREAKTEYQQLKMMKA